ncbi:MAG: hypothetical protein ACLUUO_12975 [Sellimonas intestinalis]
MAYVNQLEFNWDKVIEVAVDWVSNGAGNLSSRSPVVTRGGKYCKWVCDVFYCGFCICLPYSTSEGETWGAGETGSVVAFCAEGQGRGGYRGLFSDIPVIFQFF